MFIRWAVGLCGAFFVTWIVAPMLLNSILIRDRDPSLDTIMLREGDVIRWRSEGCANTLIGPHGLPGWRPNHADVSVVLWGDSQVEGLCVDDDDKIANQVIRIANESHKFAIDCVPIARSGTDASDWARVTPNADRLFAPRLHVWVIAELSDLLAIIKETDSDLTLTTPVSTTPVRLAKMIHAEALFQVLRSLVFDPTTGHGRTLRWSLDRVGDSTIATLKRPLPEQRASEIKKRLLGVRDSVDKRLLLVYAPAVPRIAKTITSEHPDDEDWQTMRRVLADDIDVVDLRIELISRSAKTGRFPRGFDNGSPSIGHFNEFGNAIIADAIVDRIVENR